MIESGWEFTRSPCFREAAPELASKPDEDTAWKDKLNVMRQTRNDNTAFQKFLKLVSYCWRDPSSISFLS